MRIPTSSLFTQQTSMMNTQYELLNKYNRQVVSGKKIEDASEDPILASHMKSSYDFMSDLDSYKSNANFAATHNKIFETSMIDVVDVIKDIKAEVLRAQNDPLTDADRNALAKSLEGKLNILLRNANVTDGKGQYIYGGINSTSQPYVFENGFYTYKGTDDATYINIDPQNKALYNDSGRKVFGDIATGNGTFTVTGSPTNTGTASTSPGALNDATTYVRDTYTINFMLDASNNMAYTVTGATSGVVIPPPPSVTPYPYVADSPITFNGISVPVTGAPQVGDSFTVAPSQKQNIFDTMKQLIDTVKTPINNDVDRAAYHQALTQSAANIDQAANHMRGYISEIGTRDALLKSQITSNENSLNTQVQLYNQISGANKEEAISSYYQQMMSLQMTQQSYIKLQEVMFQMIGRS